MAHSCFAQLLVRIHSCFSHNLNNPFEKEIHFCRLETITVCNTWYFLIQITKAALSLLFDHPVLYYLLRDLCVFSACWMFISLLCLHVMSVLKYVPRPFLRRVLFFPMPNTVVFFLSWFFYVFHLIFKDMRGCMGSCRERERAWVWTCNHNNQC